MPGKVLLVNPGLADKSSGCGAQSFLLPLAGHENVSKLRHLFEFLSLISKTRKIGLISWVLGRIPQNNSYKVYLAWAYGEGSPNKS